MAVGLWKTKYTVHWQAHDGTDRLLGGADTIEGANEIAIEQAKEVFENPWETDKDKFRILDSIYIHQDGSEYDAMTNETEEVIDALMSEIHGRMGMKGEL